MIETIRNRKRLGLWSVARKLCVLGLLLTALNASQAFAQEFRASITGQVADSTGAVIPGATITAVNADTQVTASTVSNSQGIYSLLYLLPGTYTVTVGSANFQTMIYNSVRLDSAQQLGMNVALKPGGVTQQITVIAGAVDLETVSASLGGVVDQARVENMPSTGLMVWDDLAFTQGMRSTAEVCKAVTPAPTTNTAVRNSGKLTILAAGTNIRQPTTWMNSETTIVFLYPMDSISFEVGEANTK